MKSGDGFIETRIYTKNPSHYTLIDRENRQMWGLNEQGQWRPDDRPLPEWCVTERHTHVASAEKDEDGMWEIACAGCPALEPVRFIASRYTTEAEAIEASAAIITMIGDGT
jgi:hypothetical protein